MQHSVAHSKCYKDEQMRDSFSWSSAPGTDAQEEQVRDAKALIKGKKDGVRLCTPARGVDEKTLQDVALNKRLQDEQCAKASA